MRKNILVYLASYAISLFGNSIAAVVLPLIVLSETGNPLGAGIVALAAGIPSILGGFYGGVIIDRINRRAVSVVADFISAIAIAVLPTVSIFSDLNLQWFVVAAIIGAIGDMPGMTAREAMLPTIVKIDGGIAERVLGIREAIVPLVMLIGPAVAGTLMFLLQGSLVLWITAATSTCAALLTLLLPKSAGVIEQSGQDESSPLTAKNVHKELLDGLNFIFKGDQIVLGTLIINLILVGVLTGFQNLILPVHFTNLGSSGNAGYVLSAIGLGSMLGAALYAAFGARGKRRIWFVVCMLGTLVGFSIISLLANVVITLLGAVLVGICTGPVGALLGVLLIERIPEDLRGRVNGAQNSVLTVAPPVAVFGISLIVSFTNVGIAALILAAIWGICVLGVIFSKVFKNLDAVDQSVGSMDLA